MARWSWWGTQMTELSLEIWKQWIRGGAILAVPQKHWEILKAKGRLWESLASCFSISTILAFFQWHLMTMPSSFFSVFCVLRMEDTGTVYHLWHPWRALVCSGLRTFSSVRTDSSETSLGNWLPHKTPEKGNWSKARKTFGGYDIKPPELRLWQSKSIVPFISWPFYPEALLLGRRKPRAGYATLPVIWNMYSASISEEIVSR